MSIQRIPISKYAGPFALSWMIWAFVHVGILHVMGADMWYAITDSLIYNLLLLGCAVLQVFMLQFYFPKQHKATYVIVAAVSISLIVNSLGNFILSLFYGDGMLLQQSQDVYVEVTNGFNPVRFSVMFLLSACVSMINILIFTLQEEKSSVQRKIEAENLSREAELFQLRSQLQPHFLFNSLNSISALAGSKPEEARKMIQQLSDFLRGTIRKDSRQLITLAEELKHLKLYLEIEKVRFGHRLQTEIDCPEECLNLQIPSLLLQPVLENAIKFGLYDTLDAVLITIKANYAAPYLQVEIANPFDKDTQPAKGTGFGLSAVSRRLYLLYARTDLLQTRAESTTFITTITIPQSI